MCECFWLWGGGGSVQDLHPGIDGTPESKPYYSYVIILVAGKKIIINFFMTRHLTEIYMQLAELFDNKDLETISGTLLNGWDL